MEFTTNQQRAIYAKGNLLVSAAAGSGKTAVLTERVIQLITGDNPVDIDKFCIVTFTKAAASEMRGRIRDSLNKLITTQNGNIENLKRQQLLLAKATISTIDSLCSRIVRENFQKLGLSTEHSIASNNELQLIKSDAVDYVFEELYKVQDAEFLSLLQFVGGKNDTKLSAMILEIYEFSRSFAFPLEFIEMCVNNYSTNIWSETVEPHIRNSLVYYIDKMTILINEISNDSTVYEKYGPAFLDDLEQMKIIYASELEVAGQLLRERKKMGVSAIRGYNDPSYLAKFRKERDKIFSEVDKLQLLMPTAKEQADDIEILLPQIKYLFKLTKIIYLEIQQRKKENQVMDYSDLEQYAVELMFDNGEKSELGKSISASFECVMVDECQDINNLQDLIFTLLSNGDNLFMVGDIKQSIYRFRKAMPEIFIDKKKHFDGTLITLEQNFRSSQGVCDAINFIFSRIMSEQVGDIAYTDGEMLECGSDNTLDKDPIELHFLATSDVDNPLYEAAYIASTIRKMVESGYMVQDKNGQRVCEYSDFVVLLRSVKNKISAFVDGFNSQGVKCFTTITQGYFSEYEIAVIHNLLQVIDNPLKDISLLSVLMSPIFLLTADKVTEIRLKNRDIPLYLALKQLSEDGDLVCRGVIARIADFRKASVTMSTFELLEYIYKTTDFLELSNKDDSTQSTANLRLFLNYALEYEKFGDGGLSGFLRYIERILEKGNDFDSANIKKPTKDSVRIMTIHGAKGLEFPVCILANCATKFRKNDRTGYSLNAKLGFAMKITEKDRLKSYAPLPLEAINWKSTLEGLSEEMRVLYVALTRAKQKIIAVTTLDDPREYIEKFNETYAFNACNPYAVYKATSFSDWFMLVFRKFNGDNACNGNIATNVDAKIVIVDDFTMASEIEKKVITNVASLETVARLHDGFEFEYPYEKLTKIPEKLTVTALAKQQRIAVPTLKAKPKFLQDSTYSANEVGTIVHSFMQYADYDNAKSDIKAEIKRLVECNFLTSSQVNVLDIKRLESFFNSSLYMRMRNAKSYLREYKFIHYITPNEAGFFVDTDEKILIQGIADLLIFEDDGIVIVDYKTDREKNLEVLTKRYYEQFKLYKQAIQNTFNERVKQCILYSIFNESEIVVEIL